MIISQQAVPHLDPKYFFINDANESSSKNVLIVVAGFSWKQ